MKKTISAALLTTIIFAFACTQSSRTASINENSTTEVQKLPKVVYGSPIIIDKTDILLYPLAIGAKDYDGYKREPGGTHWNFIFYNILSGKSELLTQQKMLINSFSIGHAEKNANHQPCLADEFIYYNVTDSDHNQDKKLTTKDPSKLYLSTREGKSFTRISPGNYELSSWTIDDKHDLILMDLIKDTNGDKEFNENDEVEHFTYNLKTGMLKNIFDLKFNEEVKNLAKKTL